jgi:hypothetical protein
MARNKRSHAKDIGIGNTEKKYLVHCQISELEQKIKKE